MSGEESEIEKMLKDLNIMYEKLKGDEDRSKFNDVKDNFDRVRFQANQKMTDSETLLDQRDKLINSNNGKDIMEKKKIENKVDNLLDETQTKIKELEIELKVQKKRPKLYSNIASKEEMINLMKERLDLLKSRLSGEEIEVQEVQDNRSALQKLEELIENSKSNNNSHYDNRDLNDVEKAKIEEWKNEKVSNELFD